MKTKRVAVIGLDGMSWPILNDLFDRGAMPHLKRLVKNSVRGVLKSTVPPVTPPAWTSIASGVNPGKHGIFDFVKFDESYNTRLVTSFDVKYPRIHEMVAMQGLKSVCVNLPFSFPILRIKNAMVVSDFIGPRICVYPQILEKHVKKYGPYDLWKKSFSLDKECETTAGRVEAINNLMRKLDWNLFFVVLMEPDHIFHRYGFLDESKDAFPIFNEIDKIINTAVETSDLVVIVSDHGFSSYTYRINMNSYLDKLGLINRTSAKVTKELIDFKAEKQKRALKRFRISPSLYRVLSIKPIKASLKMLYKLFTGKELRAELPYVDPVKSKAFSPTPESFGIYVKEETLVNFILEKLKTLNGIEYAWRREEVYHGPYVNLAPHIIFAPNFNDGFCTGSTVVYPNVISEGRFYYHHPDGIMMFYADDISAKQIPPRETVDITPTILNYLGLPLPVDTDGTPIPEVAPAKNPKRYNYLKHWKLIKKIQTVKTKLARTTKT